MEGEHGSETRSDRQSRRLFQAQNRRGGDERVCETRRVLEGGGGVSTGHSPLACIVCVKRNTGGWGLPSLLLLHFLPPWSPLSKPIQPPSSSQSHLEH